MTVNADKTIERIKSGYSTIFRLYQNVPASALVEPMLSNNWSVKDVVGHITAWVWRCSILLEHSHKTDALIAANPDREGLNREFYHEISRLDWTQVEIDFAKAHQALFNAIKALPPHRLAQPVMQRFIAENTWMHYAEHLPEMVRWHNNLLMPVSSIKTFAYQPQAGAI